MLNIEDSCETKSMVLGLLLCGISVFILTHHKWILYDSKDYFTSPMTDFEKKEMLKLLYNFIKVIETNQIEYFIHMGTLIGSVRHHGLIPWDDDIDVYVDINQKENLVKLLRKMEPIYKLYNTPTILEPYGQWKFYKSNGSRSYIHRSFKWPYIDIWFYDKNATHINHELLSEESILRSDVYPLMKRPFGEIMVSAPCNAMKILSNLNIEQCKSRSFSHLFEVPLYNWWQRVISCSKLYSHFPFVFHETFKGNQPYYVINNKTGNIKEILKIGDLVISNVTIYQPICSQSDKSQLS